MAAHLKKPFNPAFWGYKAHSNKYKCDFFVSHNVERPLEDGIF